ncbi:MAG TPA: DUF6391 domain-containing protein [Ktedonobacteraceae bacterium]|jgi:hypothetical protein|nr:DUF6391 domain-containing protein [Ktedonobacteraceae bacterium]
MKPDDMLFGRRIRQNHALEHATITILSGYVPDLRVSARSSSRGFIIFGDVDLGQLRRSLDEALQRLQAGEAELAIHPNCGTNLVVGVSLVTMGTLLGMTSSRARTRIASTAFSSVAGIMAARPLGQFVQKHVTTLPDLQGVRVSKIFRRKILGMTIVEVRTVQE